MLPIVSEMCIVETASIREALEVIDKNRQGICFVHEVSGDFLGVVTDGDIRRCLLSSLDLNDSVKAIVNQAAISFPFNTPSEVIQKSLSSKIRHIPLLSGKQVVDYACVHRLHRIPVMEPFLGGNELAYVTQCITSGWISSKGAFVTQFEEMLAEVCESEYAVAVSNGTTALHLALEALGIGAGDEVIVPNFTFAASINSILYTGATPVIVDVNMKDWNVSIDEIKKALSSKTKAIMPVHIYGAPCDMDAILNLAKSNDLFVVEDCAEAIGSLYKGKPVGSFGDAATFSFFGNKVITTGEGGMVIFKNEKHYQKGKILRDHGMSPDKRYWHEMLGYNYRMTNLQAAVGVAQMEQFRGFLEKKQNLAQIYTKYLKDIPGIIFQELAPYTTSCHWLFTMILSDNIKIDRDELVKKLLANGIETRPTFYPLHEMPLYQKYAKGRSFSNTEMISRRGISLPSSITLSPENVEHIAGRIRNIISVSQL